MEHSLRDHLLTLQYRYHTHHPFDRLLQSGCATREVLQLWASNRYYYQDTIPRKDAAIVSKCRDSAIRELWTKHITTHDADGALSEWLLLTRSLGLSDEDVTQGRFLLPGTKFACDAYLQFCKDATWQEGMCSSMTHLFAGDIHSRRIANWPTLYPWIPDEAFTYFRKRTQTLPDEIDVTLQLLSDHFCQTPDRLSRAKQIVSFKQDVLWTMLDALWHHVFSVECRIPDAPPPPPPPRVGGGGGRFRVLGSGAGGGVPQWNKTDSWNQRARKGLGVRRTQSSFAASVDGTRWLLLNCSPDFTRQWNDLVDLYPDACLEGVLLTDAQLDHVSGLLSLRESRTPIALYCTPSVHAVLEHDSHLLTMLRSYVTVVVHELASPCDEVRLGKLHVQTQCIGTGTARYASRPSDVLAVTVSGTVLVMPCVPSMTPTVVSLLRNPPAHVLFDGTFATDSEMPSVKGHVSMEETLRVCEREELVPPTFVHINNTNHGLEQPTVLAHDGLEFSWSVEDEVPHDAS